MAGWKSNVTMSDGDESGPVAPSDDLGWDGDMLEARAFAHLAVRSLRGLPLSLPTTTGAPAPTAGGALTYG